MEALRPAPALEDAPRELVDDLHLAVLEHVVLVPLEELLRLQRGLELVDQVLRHLVVQVLHAEGALDLLDARLEGGDAALLLVDLVVLVALEAADHAGELVVELRRVADPARDDERGAGLVHEDRVDLVDDRVRVAALHLVGQRHRHVVAEVVEAELVVRAVGDVAGVLRPLVHRVEVTRDHEADVEAEEVVHPAHPLRVERGEVVVHGDEVDALAGERVEVHGQRRHEGLALARLHLGDPPEVEGGAAHQLHVVVALADRPLRGLAHDRERLDQQVVDRLAVLDALAELRRLRLQLGVGQLLHRRLERVDVGHEPGDRLDLATLSGAEDFVEDSHEGTESTDAPPVPSAVRDRR